MAESRKKDAIYKSGISGSALIATGRSASAGDKRSKLRLYPLLIVLLVASLALFTQVSMAHVVNEGSIPVTVSGNTLSTYVVSFNTASSAATQAAENDVSALVVSNGGEVVYTYTLVNAMAVKIPDNVVGILASVPGVEHITKDYTVQISMDQVVNQIDVRNLWNATSLNQQYGGSINGSGVTICVIDTGVCDTHPDLQGKIAMERDFTNFSGGPGLTAPDDNGHGTFVASEIVGSGVSSMYANGSPGIPLYTITGYQNLSPSDPNYTVMRGPFKGIATGAQLDCFKVAGATGDTPASIVEMALDYACNETDMNGHRPNIISMSLDSGVTDPVFTQFVENAVNDGIIVVVAAGNDGPTGSVESPADAPDAITVGSVNRDDTVSSFSAHGPTAQSVDKPDIMGVGQTVIAAKPVVNNGADGPTTNFSKYYMVDTGTSMATPEVAAVAALILQVNPNLTPAQVKELLMDNARKPADYGVNNAPGAVSPGSTYWGAGIVDAYATILNMTNGNIPPISPAPEATISFGQTSYQVNENSGTLNVIVTADWNDNVPAGTSVNVTYEALSGSGASGAIPGLDYVLPTGTLNFIKPSTTDTESLSFPITILNGNTPGVTKSFNLNLSSQDDVSIPVPSASVSILNTNYPTVKFAINSYTVTNGAGLIKVNVMANWSGSTTNGDILVNLSVINGTAVYGQDVQIYNPSTNTPYPTNAPYTLDFKYPNVQQTVELYIVNNSATQDTKAFSLALSDPVNATLASPSSDPVWVMASGSANTQPPSTSYTLSPPSPNGKDGWYTTNVSVTLSAVASAGSSGVDHIWYNLNNGYNVKVMGNTASFTVSTNGSTTVNYWAVDKEGNAGTPASSLPINIDETSPVIYATLNPSSPNGINGWYNSSPNITISAVDVYSGIASTAYSLNGGITWKPYTGTFNVSNGTYTLEYGTVDNAGTSANGTPIQFMVGTQGPMISANLSPSSPNGKNGWYDSSPVVSINATSANSGIASTAYSLNGSAGPWYPYNGPFTVKDGQYTLVYGTVDSAGKQNNSTAPINFKVDSTPPVISASLKPASPIGPNGWYNTTTTLNVSAYDNLSGVSSTAYSLNGGSTWQLSPGQFTLSNGNYTLVYGAVDNAGNRNNSTTPMPIKVDASPPVLGQINAPSTPMRTGTAVNVNDTVSNDPSGLASATWNWGDGNITSGTINNTINFVNGSHTYSSAGTYLIWLNVTNNVGFKNNTSYNFIVVYNPSGGGVIGLGGFNSAAGNFTWKPGNSYAATFGFDSQYVTCKGITTLQGLTEFVLGNGKDLWLQSVSYDWLVVSGSEAIYQGTGTMVGNGSTQYKFIIATLPNKIRVKIWNAATGAVVYDNQMGAANDALPTQPVSWGGSLIYST